MDQFVVDLGPGRPDVAVGDDAILFGPGADGEPTAQDWADLLGTINYEVVTSPRGRIVTELPRAGPDERARGVARRRGRRERRRHRRGGLGGPVAASPG